MHLQNDTPGLRAFEAFLNRIQYSELEDTTEIDYTLSHTPAKDLFQEKKEATIQPPVLALPPRAPTPSSTSAKDAAAAIK